AVEVDGHADAGLLGVAGNVGSAHVRLWTLVVRGGIRRWRRVFAALRHGRGPRRCARASARRRAILGTGWKVSGGRTCPAARTRRRIDTVLRLGSDTLSR